MSDSPLFLRTDEAGVTTLTLNRPQSRNSLSLAMLRALRQEIDVLKNDETVRVIVLAAEGPVFSAGHDLKELYAHRDDPTFSATVFNECAGLMQAIVHITKPVIARVSGIATAAGCQLVATCDLAVAAAGTRFAAPGVNIGLFCSTPAVALSRAVSRKAAMQMLLTGDLIDDATALRIGLINDIVPGDTLIVHTRALAEKIASKSPLVVAMGKQAFYRQLEMPLGEAYAYTCDVVAENLKTQDAREGIGAFLEKRAPVWQGK